MGEEAWLGLLSNVAEFLNDERKPDPYTNYLIEGIQAQMGAKEEVENIRGP